MAMGGDDDVEVVDEGKPSKPNLEKYSLSPDANIRDVFWKLLLGCAEERKEEVKHFANHRHSLIKILLSVISSKEKPPFPISKKKMILCFLNLFQQEGWEDALKELLVLGGERASSAKIIASAVIEWNNPYLIKKLLRDRLASSSLLTILSYIKNASFIKHFKMELIIFARGDVGNNQYNAIRILSHLRDDFEVEETLIFLLSHWDERARLEAAKALKGKKSEKIKSIVEMRLNIEENKEVRKAFLQLVK